MPRSLAPRLRVFVSSRMAELASERRIVKRALDELEVDAWVFEIDAGARSETIEQTFLEELASADLYLGIFWKGIGPHTREEYDHATRLGKDRLVYEKRADLEERALELQDLLDHLSRVASGITSRRFASAEELGMLVKEDVARWQTRTIRRQAQVAQTVEALTRRLAGSEQREQFLEDQVRALTEAVSALASRQGQPEAPAGIDRALDELAAGRTEIAMELFRKVATDRERDGMEFLQEAAVAQLHLGTLALLNDTRTALDAFTRATELDPENPKGWNQLGQVLLRLGELGAAEDAFRKVGSLAGADPTWEAASKANLATVHYTRGDLEAAIDATQRALAIHRRFGDARGTATDLGNLGLAHYKRGELTLAIAHFEQALALQGELENEAGMAASLANLGLVYGTRSDFDRATEMFEQALALHRKLGQKKGMASNFGNLGNVHNMRGELDQAIAMYDQALAINRDLGNKDGMAADYGNLGLAWYSLGNTDRAQEMLERALTFNEEMGKRDGMGYNFDNLGLVCLSRGEEDRAAEMHEKALAVFGEVGNKQGMASALGNLGVVLYLRGEPDRGTERVEAALDLYRELGNLDGMARLCAKAGLVLAQGGETPRVRELLTRARDLYREAGIPNRAALVQEWLDELDED